MRVRGQLSDPAELVQAIADITQEAFLRDPYADIEAHLGKLFRTSCFNIAGHRCA